MRLTTLCYAENAGRWLMMHRVKKDADENAGKWIGLGGHLLEDETPEECVRREVREEAGLELRDLRLRGILTFILPDWGNELTFLYTAKAEDLPLPECAEGVLQWVPMDRVMDLAEETLRAEGAPWCFLVAVDKVIYRHRGYVYDWPFQDEERELLAADDDLTDCSAKLLNAETFRAPSALTPAGLTPTALKKTKGGH